MKTRSSRAGLMVMVPPWPNSLARSTAALATRSLTGAMRAEAGTDVVADRRFFQRGEAGEARTGRDVRDTDGARATTEDRVAALPFNRYFP